MQVSEPFNFSRLESILYLLLCGFKCSERCPVCLNSYHAVPLGQDTIQMAESAGAASCVG